MAPMGSTTPRWRGCAPRVPRQRAMLTRLFGDEWTERLLQEALFELPRVLGEGEGGLGVEA